MDPNLIPSVKPITKTGKIFKEQKTLSERMEESKKVREKYSDRIPVICEKSSVEKDLPSIDKNKYLVPADLTVSQFVMVVRNRLSLNETTSLFFFVGRDVLLLQTDVMSNVYERYRDEDGFLYVTYSGQNTLG
ncbi:autophagy related protein ATG8 [Naegleria gruberi]|uniref:Autophagy-related protein n=1 Tax=Naegleria gruberi TaxID=5762 RepID=D2VM10_NAEGR|nr:autophagy related protein ATG8 [Naegleria gruberi]EFC42238.1 autophagy related protein ATG8 [Naegleria gruberi]|eukprot:XP_002674982.1 autophagy related protein ATG8 [Naegleria gruberi strain NEG-M]